MGKGTTLKVKVMLSQRIANIGKAGEIIEVSHTQAYNYLIPKGLAKLISPEMEKKLQEDLKKEKENAKELDKKRHEIAEILHGKTIVLELNGVGSKIFGGIQELDIAKKIDELYKFKLDKKHIIIPEGKHIKKTGNYDIKINLGTDVYIKINLEVKVKEIK